MQSSTLVHSFLLFSTINIWKWNIQYLLLYDSKFGLAAAPTSWRNNAAFGDSKVSECKYHAFFICFDAGKFILENASPFCHHQGQWRLLVSTGKSYSYHPCQNRRNVTDTFGYIIRTLVIIFARWAAQRAGSTIFLKIDPSQSPVTGWSNHIFLTYKATHSRLSKIIRGDEKVYLHPASSNQLLGSGRSTLHPGQSW